MLGINSRGQLAVAEAITQDRLRLKALAGGFCGEQVDGNDVIAMRVAVGEAVEKARAGDGPTLIEAMTYRLSDHTTADDATRYRVADEVSKQWANEPIARLRTYLGNQGWWSKADEEALTHDCKTRLEAAQAEFLSMPPQEVTDMFDYLFSELPPALEAQRRIYEEAGDE